MGRLIDTDTLQNHIKEVVQKQDGKNTDLVSVGELLVFIDREPTAYDPDKVVEQLENLKTINVDIGFGTTVSTLRKDVVIEIIKAGGTDGN